MKKSLTSKKEVLAGKPVKNSKTIQINVLLTIAEAALILMDVFPKDSYPEVATGLIALNAIVNMVLCVWFTDTFIREGKEMVDKSV